jgi:NADH-quinone oxidoreductase subunit N
MFFNFDSFNYLYSEFVVIGVNFFYPVSYIFSYELLIFYFILINIIYIFNRYIYINNVCSVELPFVLLLLILSLFIIFYVNDLMLIYFCLELIGFISYILIGFSYDDKSRYEGALKYFIMNSVASVFIIFGIAILYLNIIETNFLYVEISCLEVDEFNFITIFGLIVFFLGFLNKLASFPCIFWIIDVYETLPFNLLILFLTIYKFAFFYVFLKLLFYVFFMFNILWSPILLISAYGSIIIGTFGAITQFKIKRFIGYTAVSQTGYVILGAATCTLGGVKMAFTLLMFYLLSITLFFSILAPFSNGQYITSIVYLTDITTIRKYYNTGLVGVFVLCIMSLANLPPLTTFFTKYNLLQELSSVHFNFSIILVLLCSIISVYYYLRLLKIFLFNLPITYMYHNLYILNNVNYLKLFIQFIFIFKVSIDANKIGVVDNLNNRHMVPYLTLVESVGNLGFISNIFYSLCVGINVYLLIYVPNIF